VKNSYTAFFLPSPIAKLLGLSYLLFSIMPALRAPTVQSWDPIACTPFALP